MTSPTPSKARTRLGVWLLVAAALLLVTVPVNALGEGTVLDCRQLITSPSAPLTPEVRDGPSFIASVLSVQRLEVDCEEAVAVRWVYVVMVALALVLVWVRPRSSQNVRLANMGLGVLVLLLASAAVFDGPRLPLGAAVVGAVMGMIQLHAYAKDLDAASVDP